MSIKDLIQIGMTFAGTLGFSMFFNIHGARVLMNAVGGTFGWIVYLLMYHHTGSLFQSYFVSAFVVALGCEFLARITKTPTTMMIVPMLFPAIPGGDLYNTIFNLFQGNFALFSLYGMRLTIEIGALNLGIVLATTAVRIWMYDKRRRSHVAERQLKSNQTRWW